MDQVLRKGNLVYGNKRNRLEKDSINPCFHKSLVTKGRESLALKCAMLLHVVSHTNGGTSPAKTEVCEPPVSLDR